MYRIKVILQLIIMMYFFLSAWVTKINNLWMFFASCYRKLKLPSFALIWTLIVGRCSNLALASAQAFACGINHLPAPSEIS